MNCASFDLILKLTQIMIALIALCVAYIAKVASDRNSVAALLKHVAELRAEKSNTVLNRLFSAMLNETEFMNAPVEKRKHALEELEREHREKRSLDMAYKKLLVEAGRAWG